MGAYNENPVGSGLRDILALPPAQVKQRAASVSQNDRRSEVFREKAEAAAAKAAALRHKETQKELESAISLLQQSAQFFKAAGLKGKAADAWLQAGEIYFTLSQYDKALASYREALRLDSKKPELLCRVSSRRARTYATRGMAPLADQYSGQALNVCNALPDPRLQAEALEARGEALYFADQLPKSVELLSKAQELFGQVQDEGGQAQALLMLAYARFRQQQAEAVQLAGKALELWSSIRDAYGVAKARMALGTFANFTDEFETARCNYERSLPMFQRTGDKDNEAITLNNIGHANRATGDLETSLENYSRARAVFNTVGDQLGAGEAITGMGNTLAALRQYQRLLPLYTKQLQRARQTKNVAQEASALANLANIYERQQQYKKARDLYLQSLGLYRSEHLEQRIGDLLMNLARLHVEKGEYAQAIALLQDARLLKGKNQQVEDVARIHYEMASIYLRLNRPEDALATIKQTIAIIESQRLKIAKFDSRANYFASVHKYYALYVQLLMLLSRKHPEQDFVRRAFETSEKSKVRSLLDLLSASSQDSPCDELLRRQLAPVDSLETRGPNVEPTASASSPGLTLSEMQAEIGNDDTVLEYMLGDKESYVWVVDPKQIVPYRLLQSDKIGKVVQRFRNTIRARELLPGETDLRKYNERVQKADKEYPLLARQLSRFLLGPVDLSRVKRVLIVPDGFLQYIPFSALPLPVRGEKNAVLMSHHEVVVLPSVSALRTLRKAVENRTPPSRTALVIADPVMERDDPRVRSSHNKGVLKPQEKPRALKIALRDGQGQQYIDRLKGSSDEAKIIQKTLGPQNVRVAMGFDASRGFVLQDGLGQYRIVHFATHGIIDASHPEMSGLILSLVNERGQSQDGYLRLGDIYNLKLSADLVVLSACNSALGKDLEAEGIIGLPRGFLHAGSRSVIASLWKVDDEASAAFMEGLYTRIQRGESPSLALRGAQLDMSQKSQWSHPFYWAGFVLQGDYK
jgi:CHAT domain-containing protein